MIYDIAYEERTKKRLLSSRFITTNGCWLWTGSVLKTGYGTMSFKNEDWRVHRLSFALFRPSEFQKNLNVNHKKECSSRRCFNPEHLYSGTQLENVKDCVEEGHHYNDSKVSCPRNHLYTEENTYINVRGARECKICRALAGSFRYLTGKYAARSKH
jgi:hypothetical protein